MNGAVIFAQNSSYIDYTKLAVFAADRVTKYLDIPVTLITDSRRWLDQHYSTNNFERVIEIADSGNIQRKQFYDGSLSRKTAEWKNYSRSSVYDLSPYDTTLVLDSDYILCSDTLKAAFDRDADLQLYRNSMDLAPNRSDNFKTINQYSIPFYWATTVVFKKTPVMQAFFDIVAYIKDNWAYYCMIYSINSHVFRNDFAFSIAIHLMNGKMPGDFAMELPSTMAYMTDRDFLVDIVDNNVHMLVEQPGQLGKYLLAKTSGMDVHIINKQSLCRFIDGGSGV
jgi:hypothetical protein